MAKQNVKHLTNEELEAAIETGDARVVFSKPNWRLVIHEGLKYSCVSSLVSLWAKPAGNSDSDYRGTKLVWAVKKVEPDTGYERKKPQKAMPVDQLIPQLKQAISSADNGRWNRTDWSLLKPENIQALIDEIEKAQTSRAA